MQTVLPQNRLSVVLVFFIAGVGCAITAVKIFWAQRQFDQMTHDDSQAYRQNVRIHSEDRYDL